MMLQMNDKRLINLVIQVKDNAIFCAVTDQIVLAGRIGLLIVDQPRQSLS